MVRKRKNNAFILPPETQVEVVGFRGDEVFKKTMRYDEALRVKATKGWSVKIYQIGFCTAEATNK